MVDADAIEMLTVGLHHVVEGGDDVAGPDVPAAQACRRVVDVWDLVDLLLTVGAQGSVAKGRLDLARQMVARRGHRVVHAFEHRERGAVFQGVDNLPTGERPEHANVEAARRNAFLAQVIDSDLGRFHVRPHADDDELRVVAQVLFDEAVASARFLVEDVEALFEDAVDSVVIPALGDFALHVGVLILHHPRHQRIGGIHQVDELFLRVADVFLHEFELGQTHRLDGVRRQEAVLHVEERRLARLGGAAADQAEVARFLRVTAKQHAPAAVGYRRNVIVPGMNVQPLARQRAGADVHQYGQTLTSNRVEHFLHQDQTLPRREVGDAPAGDGEAFAHGGGGVLALGFEEEERVAPQVLLAVHDGGVEPAAHRGGAGDRIGAGGLGH